VTPYELIQQKKEGREHSAQELEFLVKGATDGGIPDYQLTAWLMAVCFKGMSEEETYLLTDAMRSSGEQLDHSTISMPTADKHSTGGVGDKVSLVLAPLAAELGLAVPMLSGRGLGHTGGTLDKLESIPGYRIDRSAAEIRAQLESVGCSISGQTQNLVPADRRLYHLRDVTATVDSIPLIVSSIMSKKLAAGPEHLVIDLKCGSGAFMRDIEGARELAAALVSTGRRAGRKMSALITDMSQPLGRAIGHAVEVRECIDCLRGEGPPTLRELSIELVVAMASLAGLGDEDDLRRRCHDALDESRALDRFLSMVRAQGGKLDVDDLQGSLPLAPTREPLRAKSDGYLGATDAAAIGLSLTEIDGARRSHDDQLDLSAGLEMLVRVGDRVGAGQELVRIHAQDAGAATRCRERLATAVKISKEAVDPVPLILERVD